MANRRPGAPGSAGEDPKYVQIASDLRLQIADMQPAARLPTENELAEEYDTTRVTVRRAYDLLVGEALVEKRGKGYFVRRVEEVAWTFSQRGAFTDHWQHKMGELKAAGIRTRPMRHTNVRIEPAAKRLRGTALTDLLAASGDLVVCRSSVSYLAAGPLETTDLYAPFDLVKDTAFMDPAPLGVPELAAAFGQTVSGWADDAAARPPHPSEVEVLELPAATWVMDVLRRIYGAGGNCILVQHSVFNALGASFRHSCLV